MRNTKVNVEGLIYDSPGNEEKEATLGIKDEQDQFNQYSFTCIS